MIYVRLDEDEFRDLVRGKVVDAKAAGLTDARVQVILADIGFALMLDIIKGAEAEAEREK